MLTSSNDRTLSQIPKIITPLPGPRAKELIDRDLAVSSPSYTRGYPLAVARGEGCTIEDVDGNLFLDMTAGIAVTATGHSHPQIVRAIQEQASQLIHMSGTDFYYPPMVELGAIKLARYYTRRDRIIAFLGAFHGRTYGAMSLTGSKAVQRKGFGSLLPGVTHIPYGTHASLDYLEQSLFPSVVPPEEVAAIIVEPIQGEGGYIVPEAGFLERIRQMCDRHGILMIVDEVQSGIGRTGKVFAIEHWGVMPDIITLAKGIASGLPLGAILARSELMTWPSGSHATTFGGNPVACAAAKVTLQLLETELLENACRRGEELIAGLQQLAEKFDCISMPRGKGLMVAIDLLDIEGKLDPNRRNWVVDEAFYRGLLLLGCGKAAIRFCPPLIITSEQIQVALDILAQVLGKVP
jgi:4-aminobutyrate aminotransferase